MCLFLPSLSPASKEVLFLNFYADWCRFSQALKPVFEKAAETLHASEPVRRCLEGYCNVCHIIIICLSVICRIELPSEEWTVIQTVSLGYVSVG